MKNILNGLVAFTRTHRAWSIVIILGILVAGFVVYKSSSGAAAPTKYVLAAVQKGTLISTVAGTGQIASTNQIDIKPKVSGDITYIGVAAGQFVKAGSIIAKINATDAYKTYRDATQNLTAAKIAYEKSLQSSQNDLSAAHDTLQKSLDDGFNSMNNALAAMPAIFTDLSTIIYNQNHSPYLSNSNLNAVNRSDIDYKNTAGLEFDAAKNEFQKNFDDVKLLTPTSDPVALEAGITETYQTTKDLSVALKDLANLISLVKSQSSVVTNEMNNDQTLVTSYVTKIDGYVSDLSSEKTSIITSHRTLSQKTTTINGADTLDIQSAKLSLVQKQSAVSDALQTLGYYTIRAPFDGIIGKVQAQMAASASSGNALATIITKQSIATISLNEIDIAKIKTGQKTTITFDALPDLTLTGVVAQVDQIGTVTQGVVSYNVQISFDTQDVRVKPGMSMSAAIVTDVKTDVLLVPTSAIKAGGNNSTIQLVTEKVDLAAAAAPAGITLTTSPQIVDVQTGSSNDTETEITSGLKEGDVIVVRTISSTTKAAVPTSQRGGLFGTGGGGGTPRALRGN
jgi:HlyD family secretion protein